MNFLHLFFFAAVKPTVPPVLLAVLTPPLPTQPDAVDITVDEEEDVEDKEEEEEEEKQQSKTDLHHNQRYPRSLTLFRTTPRSVPV